MVPIVEAGGFLLLTRSHPIRFLLMQHATRWDLPKGHAEPGEDILQTALRETSEETGFTAEEITVDANFRHVIEYPLSSAKRGDYCKRVTYFLGFVDEPREIQLTEHIGYTWFPWSIVQPIQEQTIDPLLAAVRQHLGN
jgi:8-oxo-dGTP pyrophosphatase MutT (NUDIX family)